MTETMLTVVLIVLAAAGAWVLVAVLFAFLTAGVIHARDHRDAPYGGSPGPRPVIPLLLTRTQH